MPSSKLIRKAIFPAAGFGTRFLPVTKAQPKEMLPIVDKPVIQYLVEEAVAAGIDDVVERARRAVGGRVGRERGRVPRGRREEARREAREARAADHVGEEVAELGDGERDALAERHRPGLGADLVVLVPDGGEGLEVGVHVQDVRALEIDQSRCKVRLPRPTTGTHDILNSLIEQLGGHNHAIGLTVVRY